MRRRPSLLVRALPAALLGLVASEALAQQPGGADTGGVPRGGDGVILLPATEKPGDAKQPTLPRVTKYAPPEYPDEAEKAGLEATVVLELTINRAGKVTEAKVTEPAGHGFDEAAVAAAKQLEWEPARKPDGTPFAARILYRYTFTLKKAPPPVAPAAPVSVDSLRGTVLATGGDATLAGAQITVAGLPAPGEPPGSGRAPETLTTDEKGQFVFRDLPAGRYRVTVQMAGFDPLVVDEALEKGASMEVKYRLTVKSGAEEVTVHGDRPPRELVKYTLTNQELSRIPGTNGDALKAIQSLPGVARSLAGLLLIRGSAPQDTQIFIDGTPVPIIYHFFGLSSVVPTEMLSKIDFYPGNFGSEYGRAMGGIINAGLASPGEVFHPNEPGYHGLLQFDLIDGRALLEGPVPFLKGWTFETAFRRSWLDVWLGPVLSAAGAGVTEAPVYYDYQAVVETHPTASSRFRIAFFGSDDDLKLIENSPPASAPTFAGDLSLHTAFERLQLSYQNDFASGDRFSAVAAIGQDVMDFGAGPIYFDLTSNTLTGRIEYGHRMAKGVTVNVGTDLVGALYDVSLRLPPAPQPGAPDAQPFATAQLQTIDVKGGLAEPAAYVELELSPDERSRIVPSVRLDYTTLTNRADVSPRVNARYDIVHGFPRTTVKAGVGVYAQPPQFQEAVPPIGTSGLVSNRAIHYAVGAEQEFTKAFEGSIEGFYKELDNLVVGNPGATSSGLSYSNPGSGYVVGAEVLLKYKFDGRFFGWLAYTLSRSARVDGPGLPEYLVSWDQTHILTVLASYHLGHGWEFGGRFRLISGNLVTPNVCDPSSPTCNPNQINAIYNAGSGSYLALPAAGRNSERLPIFNQLDLRLDKKWTFKSWQLSAYLDVQNVYNEQNVEAIGYNFNYTARTYANGLPFLPILGLRAEF